MIGITGGTGFVGQRLVELLAPDAPMRVLTTTQPLARVKKVEYLIGDVTSEETVNNFAAGCASIIHLAGVAHTDLRKQSQRNRAYQVNVGGTGLLLRAAEGHGVQRFLFVSTAHVYAGQCGRDITERECRNESSFYAKTKIDAEILVEKARDRGVEAIIARPCLIYGPGVRFNLHRMLRAIDCGFYFHIAGKNPVRSFLSLENAAGALRHLVLSKNAGGTFNLADRECYSLIEFADELAARMQRKKPITCPLALVRAFGSIGSACRSVGIPAPISRESIQKLTNDFSLNVARLAQSGFQWMPDPGLSRQEMVDFYLREKHWSLRS